eukprot:TRINITY_DN1652_c0_g1_i2.p1 TRINITY_DN1652_c0_g1~~TRINITY_DN1652_c0_g1_i2.p1  ORF type:complete len:336 (+),score=93.84 TRINITY_DN1652_c0_g1_i2:69-1076(+)
MEQSHETKEETSQKIDTLLRELQISYVKNLEKKNDNFEYWALEHLKVSGIYWALGAMDVLQSLDQMDLDSIRDFIVKCQHPGGGFGGNVDHDPHLLYTLSAVQVMAMLDSLDRIDIEGIVKFVAALQKEDGSFTGDEWGEVDTRFSYIAICTLALLKRLDSINVQKAVDFILKCKNFDGGFGCIPGAESHAGQVFCCVGALAITNSLHHIDVDLLGWWLCERQVKEGGLNGRPEKLPDVCYSWWVLSALSILERLHWINKEKLVSFILNCQDDENGGIADRPGDMADIYHTFFGVGGLSLMGEKDLNPIDAAFAINPNVLKKLGIEWKKLSDYNK